MMMNRYLMGAMHAIFAICLLFSTAAYAASQIENVEGSPIPDGLSDEQIVKAMQTGGMVR